MKVKELSRTGNVAWSPSSLQSIYLACGTVAQQLDATFSTSAKLEIFSLDLATQSLEMPLAGSVEVPQRFHKLVWSGQAGGIGGGGGVEGEGAAGIIIGGSDNGTINMWSADRIIQGSPDSLLHQSTQHVGAVRSLDVNPFQSNLLASGASDSEIFIWDLNNPTTAMTPGNKMHPLEDISGVAWNRQVQHILASTSPGGRSVVWDLRKNEPIIQVADSSSRVRCSAIAWHPDVATQMVTASGDDHAPIIQMWDLRYATAPMRTLERHKRGLLSLAWCPQDADLLLSAAKDNLVLCWNPNSEESGGEVVYELPATSQWIFEVHWCPRNPAIISTASFDGHVTLYSLLGGGGGGAETGETKEASAPPTPTDDIFAGIAAGARTQHRAAVDSAPLKTPPKWLRRPCGASFAFGGKLVSFGDTRGADVPKRVQVSQVITEGDLLNRSNQLEESLSRQRFSEFCEVKISESSNTQERNIWNFLKVTFEPNPRRQYLKLLGYDTEELERKFDPWGKLRLLSASNTANPSSLPPPPSTSSSSSISGEPENIEALSRRLLGDEGAEEFAKMAASIGTSQPSSSLPARSGGGGGGGGGGLDVNELSRKLLRETRLEQQNEEGGGGGGGEGVSESEASSTAAIFGSEAGRSSMFDTISVPQSSEPSTQPSKRESNASFLQVAPSDLAIQVPVGTDVDGMLAKALLVGNFEAAVDICIVANRMPEALIVAVAGGSDLLLKTQNAYLRRETKISKLLGAVINHNWRELVTVGNLENWREILAALVTYASPEHFASLCDSLGWRLEEELDGRYRDNASLCYICSGNIEKFVECWNSSREGAASPTNGQSVKALQDLVEKVVLLRKAVDRERNQLPPSSSSSSSSSEALSNTFRLYARLLASQGSLTTALSYLQQSGSSTEGSAVLHDRVYQAQDVCSGPKPEFPFPIQEVEPLRLPEADTSTLTPSQPENAATTGLNQPVVTQAGGGAAGVSASNPYVKGYRQNPPSSAIYSNPPVQPQTTPTMGYPGQPPATYPGMGVSPPFGGTSMPVQPPNPPTGLQPGIFNPAETSTQPSWNPPAPAPPTSVAPPISGITPRPPANGKYNTDTAASWNDPPTLKAKRKPMSAAPPLAPITAPVMAPIGQPEPHMPPSAGNPQPMPSPVQKKPPSPAPAPVVQKEPVPQEHVPMMQTFEGMLTRCRSAVNSNALRRKIDEVNRRLEVLGDLLRRGELSMEVLQGLHYIAQDLQALNYHSALGRLNQMVSSGNFSEMSSFMPGIKSLIQLGIQLRV